MKGLPWDSWNPEAEITDLVGFIRDFHEKRRHRYKGCVIGLSGGLDSSVSASLLVKALGAEKVFGLIMPAPQSYSRDQIAGQALADSLGIQSKVFPIGGILEAMGVDAANSTVDNDHIDFQQDIKPLYQGQVARTELPEVFFKYLVFPSVTLRTRFLVIGRFAEAMRYSRCQTLNRSEIVTLMWTPDADTGGDIALLSHLWKTQVYRMAEVMDLPPSVVTRLSGCGNHPMLVSDEDQMGMPYLALDTVLWMLISGKTDDDIVAATDRTPDEVARLRDVVGPAQEHYRFPVTRWPLDKILGQPV